MKENPDEAVSLDLERGDRCGFPEVVYGEGKDSTTLQAIFKQLLQADLPVLATRVDESKAADLATPFPEGVYNGLAKTFRIGGMPSTGRGTVSIVTAGTSDLPVAEEAKETLTWMGCQVRMVHDVGVAGPQRLLARLDEIRGVDAVVVVAGMEGALPSVVGGHVNCPVVGVPTSVGYGANLGGISALLSMLNSCAANVTVVNIDAGFKGGYVAGLIASRAERADRRAGE